MSQSFLFNYFSNLNIYPYKIIVKNQPNKRGCAFLEFLKHEEAEEVIKKYNGKNINGIDLRFNWVKTYEQKFAVAKIKKFTLFVGNIDKSISSKEVEEYFRKLYSSIISFKLIINQETNKSKGFAFIEFTNYKEFQSALNVKDPIFFGKQKLVFNSAKNKYDDYDEIQDASTETSTPSVSPKGSKNNESSISFCSDASTNITVDNQFSHQISRNSLSSISLEKNEFGSLDGDSLKPNVEKYFSVENKDFLNEYKNQSLDIRKIIYSMNQIALQGQGNKEDSLYKYYIFPFKLLHGISYGINMH